MQKLGKKKLLVIAGLAVVVVLLLSLLFAGGGSGKKAVAEAITAEDYVPTITAKTIPDLGLFFGREHTRIATEGSEHGTQELDLDVEGAREMVLEYIDLLTGQFGFEIVGGEFFDPTLEDPFQGEFEDEDWSVALVSGQINAGRELECIYSHEPCDLYLWGDGYDVTLKYSSVFEIDDTGHRHSGYEGDTLNDFVGTHALDAFVSKGDKHYSKADKDFVVKTRSWEDYDFSSNGAKYVGRRGHVATSVNGGSVEQGGATIQRITRTGTPCYRVELTDFNAREREEELYFYLPLEVGVGDLLTLSDLLSGHQKEAQQDSLGLYYTPNYAAEQITAGAGTSIRGSVETMSIRVLRWNEGEENICLILLGVKAWYEGDPIELECLIAAPLNDPEQMESEKEKEEKSSSSGLFSGTSGGNKTFIPDASKLDCITCGGDGDCNTCGGYGEVRRYAGAGETVRSKCSSCYGSGDCRTCGGSGTR